MERKNLLEMKGLNAGYDELKVLKNVNLIAKKGEIIALIGPNGAGKSTIIKSIFNIANVTSGEILFKGKSMRKLKTHELINEGICYINQGKVVFSGLTVRENLVLAGEYINDNKEVERRLEEVYKTFPILRERQNDLAFGLSGGQRQMLALGRTLMQKAELLLLDEPSLGLSPKLQKDLFEIIVSLRDKLGMSILIVEQNAKKAIEIADRTYLLETGEVVLSGGKDIIKHKKIREVYLGG